MTLNITPHLYTAECVLLQHKRRDCLNSRVRTRWNGVLAWKAVHLFLFTAISAIVTAIHAKSSKLCDILRIFIIYVKVIGDVSSLGGEQKESCVCDFTSLTSSSRNTRFYCTRLAGKLKRGENPSWFFQPFLFFSATYYGGNKIW